LSTTYKIVSNILLSKLTPYADEIIGNHQCRFRRNKSTTNPLFCIRKILEKKSVHNEAVHHLFTYFEKSCDLVTREVLL